ncbi:MAG: hypothetical protein IJL67_14655 [Oscillospiraceae bacterium]|nr:hypothetical protein [Oscillospiraceae bacterium]
MNTFPFGMNEDNKNINETKKIVSSALFGNRFKVDQTLYEYLIEFLLIFSSEKYDGEDSYKFKFHKINDGEINRLSYTFEPRMGLRRFVFFDKSKKGGNSKADECAYNMIRQYLLDNLVDIENKEEYVDDLQDLLHGYAVVIKKRFWGAKALLPICPEFIVCGCDPSKRERKLVDKQFSDEIKDGKLKELEVDTQFHFDKRNFLARGGELYYLHLLQGLQDEPDKRTKLETLLYYVLNEPCKKISKLAAHIQSVWEDGNGFRKESLKQTLKISYIPDDAYISCEKYSIDELINYLSCQLHPINRIDILAKGVMLQIMRMMACQVANCLESEKRPWIIDMNVSSNKTIKKIAAESYSDLENDFIDALNKTAKRLEIPIDQYVDEIKKARRDSLDIFRLKGKEMLCIIPNKGSFERFSLSEDVIRFLVLALIPPKEKMTLKMFLSKLYVHYNIVIGPNEYKKSLKKYDELDSSLANAFNENEIAFQKFLKDTGFLRELSDATSIVINPYSSIDIGV